ncbi:MAG: transposase [Solirubrobacterales bacterium]|nr:transposase [Solirubrobacterales bacterium]
MNPPHVVVAGTRRSWSAEEKRTILAEARDTATSVSAVARRHGLHASLLFRWRRDAREEEQAPARLPGPTFVPLALPVPTVVPEPAPGAIEIEVAGGHRIRVERGADPALLGSVIAALVGR